MINPKIVEAALGMIAKMVPPETYQQIVTELKDVVAYAKTELKDVVAYAKSADERLAKLEAIADRLTFLENVVRNSVDGAPAMFAERELYMVPGTIEKALAPAQNGQIDGGRNQSG